MTNNALSSVYVIFGLFSVQLAVDGKEITKCEIITSLHDSKLDESLWGQYLCRADSNSDERDRFNTSKMVQKDADVYPNPCHQYSLGIFQIDKHYCRDEGPAYGNCHVGACEAKCADADISDDIRCVNANGEHEKWPKCTNPEYDSKSFHPKSEYEECRKSMAKPIQLTDIPLWGTVLIVAISCLIVFGLTYFYYKYRQNNFPTLSTMEIKEFKYGRIVFSRQSQFPNSAEHIRMLPECYANEPYNTQYELSPSQFFVDINSCIGAGAYGVVYKGSCKGNVVAVKTLKPDTTKEYLQALLGEIKILSHIGKHECIVNMEGAFTRRLQEGIVYMFMEYCEMGNLERFLRSNRNNFVAPKDSSSSPTNEDAEFNVIKTPKKNQLTLKHLLQYAHQIAQGMEFLSSKQVIHSDLAARNVLLVDHNTAKISDFGLSRKLYAYTNYIKKKEEPLPWRWMAIESLREMNFSTSSDVWMYGVLLFEIFSLGEVPYPGLSWSLDFVDRLESGFRLQEPKHAPLNMYSCVMERTWDKSPDERPSFTELKNYFHAALYTVTSPDYTDAIEPLPRERISMAIPSTSKTVSIKIDAD